MDGGFPKLGVPFWVIHIIRTIVYWGLYWGTLILGNYRICAASPAVQVARGISTPRFLRFICIFLLSQMQHTASQFRPLPNSLNPGLLGNPKPLNPTTPLCNPYITPITPFKGVAGLPCQGRLSVTVARRGKLALDLRLEVSGPQTCCVNHCP